MSPTITQLSPSVTREDLCNGQIVVFTLTDMTRKTVDVWAEACIEVMTTCHAEGRPILVLQDFSRQGVVNTPYSTERGKVIADLYPDLKGRTAFLLPPNQEGLRIKLYMKRTVNQRTRERDAFDTREEALAWLQAWVKVPCPEREGEPNP